MAPVGLSPKIQDANREVAIARPKMNTRLNNSKKVVIASQFLDRNGPFFEKHGHDILKLMNDTNRLSQSINTLNEAGYEAGPCKITKKGWLWDTQVKKPVEDVNDDIQFNLDQDVVKTALAVLNIAEEKPAPSFTLPSLPSAGTVVKGGAAIALVATGSAVYCKDRIAANLPTSVVNTFTTAYSYVPGVPDFVKNAGATAYSYVPPVPKFAKDAYAKVASYVPSLPTTTEITDFFSNKWTAVANSQAGVFVGEHKLAIGVGIGAIAAVGVAYAIYRAVQNRKSEEA
jgi:hypothetical protein